MFKYKDEKTIDLSEIALAIGLEPSIKDDGTPLVSDGKPINKAEKILRSWASSENTELQKRFIDLIGSESNRDMMQIKELNYILGLLCTCTDEVRQKFIIAWKEKYGENDEMLEPFTEGEKDGHVSCQRKTQLVT